MGLVVVSVALVAVFGEVAAVKVSVEELSPCAIIATRRTPLTVVVKPAAAGSPIVAKVSLLAASTGDVDEFPRYAIVLPRAISPPNRVNV